VRDEGLGLMGEVSHVVNVDGRGAAPRGAVAKALDILVALADAPTGLRVSEVADNTDLQVPTALRTLRELSVRGFAIRDEEDLYYLGPTLLRIATSDARVADFLVHLGPGADSAGLVGERFGRAAASFVYRSEGGWGPQMKSVAFGNPSRDVVVVTFRGVEGTLRLGDAALGGFFASANTSFGRSLDDLRAAGSPFRLPAIVGDMAVPVAYEVVDDGKLALRFAEPLPETAALSWAATRHAAYGPKRRSVLEFDVVTDDSGVTAPSFAAVPIAAFEGEAVEVEAGVAGPVDDEVRGLIGVNGTNGMAVLPPAVEAGAPGWRQSNWNPASRYLWPHLIDSEGRVTDVYWNSYQHHQPRMQRMDPVEGDAALRAGLLGDWGTLGNLPPNTRIDLAIYLLQSNVPLDRSLLTVRVAHLLPETEKRRQQRAERHAERRFTAADLFGEFEKNHPRQTLAEQPVLPPAEEAVTAEWIVADAANDWRGNVLVLEGVETGPLGVVQVFLDQKKPPKDHPIPKGQRVEHKLLAVQARITVEPAR